MKINFDALENNKSKISLRSQFEPLECNFTPSTELKCTVIDGFNTNLGISAPVKAKK